MNRDSYLQQIGDRTLLWDIIVIGGGATGLGAAVDAAARGYKTVLLEQHDFAKATSSRSTKLIHGGVRYLRLGNLRLVRESLRERGLLLRHAPHLVQARAFVVPSYRWWENRFYGLGLKAYDALAGSLRLGTSRSLSSAETLAHIPTLRATDLRGGTLYLDGQFDDARLAINLAQTVADLGGVPLNYVKVAGFLKSGGRISGVLAVDVESGEEFPVRGRAVINASGVFGTRTVQMDDPTAPEMLTTSQGIHLVFDRAILPGDSALLIPRTDDGRVLFAIPWLDRTIVGTTDTPVTEPSLEPRALDAEIDFLLHHANRYFTVELNRSKVLSVFAGLRPLVKPGRPSGTGSISRDYLVTVSRSGLVTVMGGKWTIYRQMGEAALDRAVAIAGLPRRPSFTRDLPIHGWTEHVDPADPLDAYGSDARSLRNLIAAAGHLGEPIHARLPYLKVQVVWAARHEAARTIEDVLARRTRSLLLEARASIESAPGVAELLAEELGRRTAWREAQIQAYTELARGYQNT
jgi:glycerol-3-phosphate dehydrogenase